MIEQALRYEIEQAIPELSGEIYPTNAPETHDKPYLVYLRNKTNKIKTLQGYTNKQALSYMWSVMAVKYGDMLTIRNKLEQLLMSMAKTQIGANGDLYIEDLTIDDINETYEFNLGMNRGIIIFTIYF